MSAQIGSESVKLLFAGDIRLTQAPHASDPLRRVPTRNMDDLTGCDLGGGALVVRGFLGTFAGDRYWLVECQCGVRFVMTRREISADERDGCDQCAGDCSNYRFAQRQYKMGNVAWFAAFLSPFEARIVEMRRAYETDQYNIRNGSNSTARDISFFQHQGELHEYHPDCRWCEIELIDAVWREFNRPDSKLEAALADHSSLCECDNHAERRLAAEQTANNQREGITHEIQY